MTFQDDNARIHKAQIGKELFRKDETYFSHMDLPPESPDLNPTEHLWDILEKAVVRLSHHRYKILIKKESGWSPLLSKKCMLI